MEIVHLGPGDEDKVVEAGSLFDDPVSSTATHAFLADERHHLLIAYVDGEPAGFVTAVEMLHPDKHAPEMFLYELGVHADFRRRGVATALVGDLLVLCRRRGCREMWVLTESDNVAALGTYTKTGGTREDTVMFTYDLSGDIASG